MVHRAYPHIMIAEKSTELLDKKEKSSNVKRSRNEVGNYLAVKLYELFLSFANVLKTIANHHRKILIIFKQVF